MTAELDFIIGRAGTGKTRACLEAMRERLQENPLGPALILLLPEHMTFKVERELAESIPQGKGFLRSYVFGFRRFARHVLLETGHMKVPRISEVGRRLLLRKILTKHQKEKDLDVFARAVRQRGFTESLSDAIKEFKSYRLTTDVLREAAAELASGTGSERLAGKLQEMALLTDEFQAEMQGKANDAEDMMQKLAEALPEAPLMKGAEVWLDGFIFFNPQEMAVLRSLLISAAKVHIALPMAGSPLANGRVSLDSPENLQETALFNRPYRTLQAICQMARQELGYRGKIDIHLLTQQHRFAEGSVMQGLEQELFRYGGTSHEGQGGVRLVEAANRRLEVENAAADILRLVRDEGWHYREIGLLVRDAESYDELVRLVFADYGIPFFEDAKRPSIHHPLAELMRSAIEVVAKDWRYETVFRCLRTGFFPPVREDIDRLENYVLEFGIRGRKRWQQEAPWDWHRRYTLDDGESVDEDTASTLALIDALRRQAVEALILLEKDLHAAEDVRGYTTALYDFLVHLDVPNRLQEWAELAEKEGRLADAAEHRQLWDDSMALFDQLVEVSGTEKMSLADYEAILSDGLDALQISLIPPGLDYVTLAPFDQNSLDNTRALYILGADADTMPRRVREQGIFSDADRLHIAETLAACQKEGEEEHTISRGGHERSFGEKFLLYRGFTEAHEYLWISYALADAEGNGLQASSLFKKIRALYPEVSFVSIPLETVRRDDDLLLAAPRPALSGLANALRSERELGTMQPCWRDVYNWARAQDKWQRPLHLALAGIFAKADEGKLPKELAEQIFAKGTMLRGSVTQFEKFRQCPFAHFAAYGLKLQERKEYQFRSMDLGQLLHAVLKEYGGVVKKDYANRWQDVPEQKRSAICEDLVNTLAPRLQSEILLSRDNYRHLKKRIEKTAEQAVNHLSAWAAVSEFQPAFFEEAFGHPDDEVHLKPLPLGDGYALSFKGQIDRLDLHESAPYYLILDYKTGHVAINLFEVYYGLRLQLLVYMMVGRELLREQGENRLPAGILYAFLQNPLLQTRKKYGEKELEKHVNAELRMPGWVLADIDVAKAIDSSFDFIKPGLRQLKDEKKKTVVGPDGKPVMDFDANSRKYGYIRSPEEFELMLAYVDYILKDTGREILSGNISASPYRLKANKDQNACTYCEYRDVCGFDPDVEGYSYRDIGPEDDVILEEKMAECTGKEKLIDAIHGRSAEGNSNKA